MGNESAQIKNIQVNFFQALARSEHWNLPSTTTMKQQQANFVILKWD